MNAIVKSKDGSTFNMLLQNGDSDRFSSRSDSLLKAAEQFVAQKKSLEITKVNSNKKIEYPPQLFNMTGLQKYCAEKYQITPKRRGDKGRNNS